MAFTLAGAAQAPQRNQWQPSGFPEQMLQNGVDCYAARLHKERNPPAVWWAPLVTGLSSREVPASFLLSSASSSRKLISSTSAATTACAPQGPPT